MSEVSEAPPPRLLPIGDEVLREATVTRRRSSLLSSPRRGLLSPLAGSSLMDNCVASVVSANDGVGESDEDDDDESDKDEPEGTRTPPMPVLTPGECYREEEDMESSDDTSSPGWSPVKQPTTFQFPSAMVEPGDKEEAGEHNIPILEKISRDFHQRELVIQLKRELEDQTEEAILAPLAQNAASITPAVQKTPQPVSEKKKAVRKRVVSSDVKVEKKIYNRRKKAKVTSKKGTYDFDSDSEMASPLRTIAAKFRAGRGGVNKNPPVTSVGGGSTAAKADRRYLTSPYISLSESTAHATDGADQTNGGFQVVNPALCGRGDSANAGGGVRYRPNVRLPGADELTSNGPRWVCTFCGKDSKFLELGCLYGPYTAAATENEDLELLLSELPLSTVYKQKPLLKSHSNGSLRLVIKSSSPQQIPAPTVTRVGRQTGPKRIHSMAVPAPRIVNHGGGGGGEIPQLQQQPQLAQATDWRIVGETGEVWFHRECLLWAPGTFLRGDGKIGGLGEALKMALNATCTYCRRLGAILSCVNRGCSNCFHYYCAFKEGVAFDEDQLTIVCSKHKHK